jgi:hypothetical protein
VADEPRERAVETRMGLALAGDAIGRHAGPVGTDQGGRVGGARSAHFAAFRMSFAVQAFVVRNFNETAEAARDLPAKIFRPGFLKGFSA